MDIIVGNYLFTIQCNHNQIKKLLQERYRPFLADKIARRDPLNKFTIHTEFDNIFDEKQQKNDYQVIFENQQVRITTPNAYGNIYPKDNYGAIKTTYPNAIEEIDYFFRVCLAVYAFQNNSLLIHGAGIIHNNAGYLFIGASGSGKTTIASYSKNSTILNDDLILLTWDDSKWVIFSTPFWNPTQVKPQPGNAELKRIFRIIQSKTNSIAKNNHPTSLALLLSSIPIINNNSSTLPQLFSNVEKIIKEIPLYDLRFTEDISFWKLIDRLESNPERIV